MSRYEIDVEKYVENNTLVWERGAQYRVNHYDCPQGVDNRQRLYIKASDRHADGWIAHCFNCNKSGAHFATGAYKNITTLLATRETDEEFTIVRDVDSSVAIIETSGEPVQDMVMKLWLYKYFIFEEDWNILKIKQYAGHSLVFPVGKKSYQLRTGFSDTKGKRYRTYLANGDYMWWLGAITSGRQLVITEDVLSAYRVVRDLQCDALALLGRTISDELIKYLASTDYRIIYVWLDEDLAGKEAVAMVVRKLILSVPAVSVTSMNKARSPKEWSPDELKEVAKARDIIA